MFPHTVRHEFIRRLAKQDMNFVCSNNGLLTRVSQGTVRQWFAIDIFRVLRRMDYNSTLALLSIARLVKDYEKASDVKWFLLEHEMPKWVFVPSAPKRIRKRADGTEAGKGGLDEVRLVY